MDEPVELAMSDASGEAVAARSRRALLEARREATVVQAIDAALFAGLAVVAAMGFATYVVFAFIENRMTGWATRRQNAPLSGGG